LENKNDLKLVFNVLDYPEMIGMRLDKALSLLNQVGTRSRASYLINSLNVLVNNKPIKSSYTLKEQDNVEISFPLSAPIELQPLDVKLDVLFEDQDLIVINKPSGMVVHPAAGHAQDTLVNALIAHADDLAMKFGEDRPGIVHRLDKDTSGIIVVAKNDETQEALTAQFKERSIHRVYYAVCIGTAKNLSGSISSFLARHPIDRKKYASVADKNKKILVARHDPPSIGKWAVTHYEVLGRKSSLTYMKLKLETGRTHQIRVHLSENGLPIAGDTLYGADKRIKSIESKKVAEDIRGLTRFLLHAAELGFTHPRTNQRMLFTKEWPDEYLKLIKSWGF
jgi:23S rRNA pseudouridine1911/1915/1917 synthase